MKMSEQGQKWVKELVTANRELDLAARSAENAILAGFRRAEATALGRISELLVSAPNFSKTDLQARLAWYLQNLPSQELAAADAQYFRAVKGYLDKYTSIGGLAEKVLAAGQVPENFTLIPKELISALQKRDLVQFADLKNAAHNRLDKQLLDAVVVGRTPAGALADIKGTITGSYPWGKTRGLYEWHAGTYARTAQMRFARQTLKAKADELKLEWFVYIGPVDSKKRPFCLELVGGVYNRQQIEDFDNGQTGDTFSDGGGYNCRDTWSPVDKKFAEELNQDTAETKTEVNKEVAKQGGAKPPVEEATHGRLMDNSPWRGSLTGNEVEAIEHWKRSGYVDMRRVQYSAPEKLSAWAPGRMAKAQARVQIMEQALDRAKPFQGTIYRGLNDVNSGLYDKFMTSKELTMNALSSASKSQIVASGDFASYGNYRILMKIRNRTAVDIEKIGGQRTEAEVVLRKGARYKVLKAEEFTTKNTWGEEVRLLEMTLEEI